MLALQVPNWRTTSSPKTLSTTVDAKLPSFLLFANSSSISKNNTLRPMRPVRLTHLTPER